MYDNLVAKVISHFGREGIIQNSKSNDYFHRHLITMEDIKMYYDFLLSKEPFPANFANVSRINQISCCLYYLSKNDNQLRDRFCHQIIEQLKPRDDEINDSLLGLIYNVIEFDEKYLSAQRNRNRVNFLLSYLERFSAHPKTITNYLLYKYYRGLLKLQLGDVTEANTENLEIIMSINEDVKKKTHYIMFINLKNDLFKVKLIDFQNEDLPQQSLFLKELFDKVKNQNKVLAIKLGFGLYSNYFKQNKLKECIDILTEMKALLKKGNYRGDEVSNGLDFYLDIASRLGYVALLMNDKTQLVKAQKKINKALEIIKNDEKDEKLVTLKTAYSFISLIFKYNCKTEVIGSKDTSTLFRSAFIPNTNQASRSYIITNSNVNDCIMNLNIINNMDPDVSSYSKNIINYCFGNINKSVPLKQNMVMTFILGVHGQIKNLTLSYCSDKSQSQRENYKKQICDISKDLLNYVKNERGNYASLIQTPFLKSAIIEIFSANAHVYIYENKMDNLSGLIKFFDDLCKSLGINESIPSYDLVCKVRGDYWRMNNSEKFLDGSIVNYEKALKLMDKANPRRGIVYFNMGCVNFFSGKKNLAIENINRAINEFNHVDTSSKDELLDFYIKVGDVLKKKEIAQKMLDILNSNK